MSMYEVQQQLRSFVQVPHAARQWKLCDLFVSV